MIYHHNPRPPANTYLVHQICCLQAQYSSLRRRTRDTFSRAIGHGKEVSFINNILVVRVFDLFSSVLVICIELLYS